MKEKIFNKMIDYCLLDWKLKDFVKKYHRALIELKLKKQEIFALWFYAKQEARELISL